MTKWVYGIKILTAWGTTESDRFGSTPYLLPRPDQKWGDVMVHPHPAPYPDGSDCGSGRYHLMKRLDKQYAPTGAGFWLARCRPEDVVGASSEKLGVTRLQLRRITDVQFAKLLRRGWGRGCQLGNQKLSYASLRGTNLRGAVLSHSILKHANLRDANLTEATLQYCDLQNADLRGADLVNADLENADLRDAHLDDAGCFGIDLRHARLDGSMARGTDFTDAYAPKTHWVSALLDGADFSGANLRGATLYQARLTNATLENADLRECDLRGALMRGANLSGAHLEGARFNENTRFPADFNPVKAGMRLSEGRD